MLYKLGKLATKEDNRTLYLAKYLTPALPPAPQTFQVTDKISTWGMMKNDTIGDCTCAAYGHMVMAWLAAATGKLLKISDSLIISAYSAIAGYNSKTGANDNGAAELDVLNYMRKIGIAGHKITAFTKADLKNPEHVRQTISLFGGAYIGLALPLSAQKQSVWDVIKIGARGDGKRGSWGGHAVCAIGYDESTITVVTWGSLQKMTWAFWNTYCDESYALISPDYFTKGKTPMGFDMTTLEADLQAIKGNH